MKSARDRVEMKHFKCVQFSSLKYIRPLHLAYIHNRLTKVNVFDKEMQIYSEISKIIERKQ